MLSAFFLHRILAVLFLLIIPLPIVALIKIRKQTDLRSSVIWQNLIRITNVGLVIVLITGITIYPIFSSIRIWVAIILTVVLGGLLAIISKQLKQYNMRSELSAKLNHLKRISILGFTYLGVIIVIFGFMAHWYQF